MDTLSELVEVSYAIAKEKGWHESDRSIYAITLLMQSEVAEVIEEYRKHKGLTEVWYEQKTSNGGIELTNVSKTPPGKPAGIPVELADLIIRIADYCGKADIPLESFTWNNMRIQPLDDFEMGLALVNHALAQAWADPMLGTGFWLGRATAITFHLAGAFNIDLWAVINEKTEYNRTRSYRHGGKRI